MSPTRGIRALLMLLFLVAATGPALVACASEAQQDAPAAAVDLPTLDAPEFAERMSEPGTVLLDVRTPEEFEAGHIEGAVNLPLVADDFAQQVERLDADASYAVYCRTDSRSGEALQVMARHGLTDAYDLDGGMEAWQAYGGMVVTE
jgi:phage shock protein E